MLLRRTFQILALLVSLSACVRAGAGPLAALADLSAVRSVDIRNDWMGLSEFGPVGRHFVLKPAANGFEGTATFSLGGGSNVRTKDVPIAVPTNDLRAFLDLLSRAPLRKGEYKPSITHTDDYPSVKIEVTAGAAKYLFYSASQGDDAVPWGADIAGEKHTIDSKAPMDAFRKLEPYFKEDEFGKFTEVVRAELQKARKGR